jgi:hypothetical protein
MLFLLNAAGVVAAAAANGGAGPLVSAVDETGRRCNQHPTYCLSIVAHHLFFLSNKTFYKNYIVFQSSQVCVLDAKRYKEANPTNMALGFDGLSPAILDKPLLKWEAGSESAVVGLPFEYGQVCLSELQCFSITGEHRAGKACDYRCVRL